MRVNRKTDYLSGVSSPKTAKNRKISLHSIFRRPRYSITLGALLLAVFVGEVFFVSRPVAAVAPTDNCNTIACKFSPTQEAESYAFYYALGACVSDGTNLSDNGAFHDKINAQHAASGQWFGALHPLVPNTIGAAFLKDYGISVDGDGLARCDDGFNATNALQLWGGWEPDDALCAMGFRRSDGDQFANHRCTDEQGGSNDFQRDQTSKYYQAVKNKVYGGNSPTLSDPAKYLLYMKSFRLLCTPNATITTTNPNGTTSRDYAIKQVSGTGQDAKVTTTYYTGSDNKMTTDTVYTYNPQGSAQTPNKISCGQIANAINTASTSYAAYLKQGGEDETADNTGDNETSATTCGIEGIGYLVCPVSRFLSGIADGFYDWIASVFLDTDSNLITTDGDAGAYKAWQSLLTIANIIFVIAFLFIIFSQATGYGISNYGVKKMLPKIIIGAILINVSFYLCQALVDISNLLGYGLKDLFKVAGDNKISWTDVIGQAMAVQAGAGAAAVGAVAVGASLVTGIGVVAVIVAVVILLFILLFLIAQKVLIVLCVVISPIAFAAWLLPNTEKFFKYWWKIFYAMLIVFPLTSVVVGASGLAADIIRKALAGS